MNRNPTEALERLRRICLSWKGASERLSWGTPTFWAGKRQLAIYVNDHHGEGEVGNYVNDHHGDGVMAVWTNAAEGLQAALVKANPAIFFSPPYVGVRGWVGIRLDRRPDWKVIEGLLGDAFVMTAPKRMADS